MEAKLEQKCSVIIIGNTHYDYTLYSVLERLFREIHHNRIPCAFLEEAPQERTIEQAMALVEKDLAALTQLIELRPEISTCLNKKTLTQVDINHIAEIIYTIFMDNGQEHSFGALTGMTLEVMCGRANAERSKFYKVLETLKIQYKGIDLPKEKFEKLIVAIRQDDLSTIIQNESLRIKAMVDNILETILKEFSSGGILIVSTGMQHSRRLGANLLLELSNNSNLKNIHIEVFDCSSNYAEEAGNTELQKAVMLQTDSPEIHQIYQSMSCSKAKISEKDQQFFIYELEDCIAKLLSLPATDSLETAIPLPELLSSKIRFFDVARTWNELKELTTENNSSWVEYIDKDGNTRVDYAESEYLGW